MPWLMPMQERFREIRSLIKAKPEEARQLAEEIARSTENNSHDRYVAEAYLASALASLYRLEEAEAIALRLLNSNMNKDREFTWEILARSWLILIEAAAMRGKVRDQQTAIAQLENILPEENADEFRGYACMAKASIHRINGNFSQSIELMKEALTFFIESGDKQSIAGALNNLALDNNAIGDSEQALRLHMQSQQISQELGDTLNVARSKANQGTIMRVMGNYEDARTLYSEAYEAFAVLDEKLGKAFALNSLGTVCLDQNDPTSAKSFFEQSLRLKKELSREGDLISSLLNLGQASMDLIDPDVAKNCYIEAQQISRKLKDRRYTWAIELGLARVTVVQNDFHSSLGHFKAAYAETTKYKLAREAVEVMTQLAKYLLTLPTENKLNELADEFPCPEQNCSQVLEHILTSAIAQAESLKLKPLLCELQELSASYFETQGNFSAAYAHLKKHKDLKSAISLEKSERRLAALSIRHQVEDARRRAEIEHLRTVELQSVNQKLSRLNNEKDTFVAILAHDLRNPLGGIRGIMGGLLAAETDPNRKEILSQTESSSAQMLEIVDRLLDFSRLQSNPKDVVIYEPCDLALQVRVVIQQLTTRAKAKNIEIIADLSDGLSLFCKHGPIQQIATNLICNAIKFSKPDRRIWISTHNKNEKICLEVRDEGPGIPPDDYKKLFVPFARLSNKPTSGEASTGLGLAIVKRMTEETGGDVFCNSTVGKGTTFIVEWPVRAQ